MPTAEFWALCAVLAVANGVAMGAAAQPLKRALAAPHIACSE